MAKDVKGLGDAVGAGQAQIKREADPQLRQQLRQKRAQNHDADAAPEYVRALNCCNLRSLGRT